MDGKHEAGKGRGEWAGGMRRKDEDDTRRRVEKKGASLFCCDRRQGSAGKAKIIRCPGELSPGRQ